MIRHAATVISLLLSIIPCVVSQQHVKLSTTSAKFNLSITSDPAGRSGTFSTNQLFQFEAAASKLFHTELSDYASSDKANSHVVVTSVHVERMKRNDAAAAANLVDGGATAAASAVTLESIVSVTSSDVGLHMALEISPITEVGEENTGDTDVASILTKTVSSSDILKVLIASELVADDSTVLELSFTEFDGSPDERGVTATETDIVSRSKNEGWPMFIAGALITLVFVGIAGVGTWVYKKEFGDEKRSADGGSSSNSVHYNGDVNLDLEVATTASGVLGLKGHHPQADENVHPNENNPFRRRRRGASSSSQTDNTTAFSSAQDFSSPKTQKSGVASVSSKHPLGITSMRKLETFLTPQKAKSDRVPLYDIVRLTKT